MTRLWDLALPKLITNFLVPIKTRAEALAELEALEKDPSNLFPFDPNIKLLVAGLRRFALETYGSCEGHNTKDRHNHPWVTFSNLDDDWFLMWLSWVWRRQGGLIWVIAKFNSGLSFEPMPQTGISLADAQRDALNFGKFLLSERLITALKNLSATPGRLVLKAVPRESVPTSACPKCHNRNLYLSQPVLIDN